MAIIVGSNFSVSTNLHIDDRAIMATALERDAIAVGRRYVGMQVFVEDESANYQLLGGIENHNWVKMSDSNGSYTHPDGDGNLHVPATGTSNEGKVLMAGASAGEMAWTDLPTATTEKSGIVTLTSALDLDDETKAATAKAVKLLQDSLNTKVSNEEVVTEATPNKILKLNAEAKLEADVIGNASTATALETAVNINIAGDMTATALFDGSGDITLESTLKDSGVEAGEYSKVTVNSKGIVTSATKLTVADLNTEAITVGPEAPEQSQGIWFQIEE